MNENKQLNWKLVARYGLLGGIIAFYFTIVGMVEAFSLRNLIGTFINLGHVILFFGAIGAGFLTARDFKTKSKSVVMSVSLAAGAISSLLMILLILFIQVTVIQRADQEVLFDVQNVFVSFTPLLVKFLTFGQGPILGSLLFLFVSALMGLIGSAFVLLPKRWHRAILSGIIWTLSVGLFSENVGQIIQQVFGASLGRTITKVLFQAKTLNPIAAAIIFAISFGIPFAQVRQKDQTRRANFSIAQKKRSQQIGIVVLVLILVFLPWIVGLFLSQALFMIGLYVLMGLGLNIVVGYAGLLDLGYVAFFAFGAYTMGILTSTGPLGVSGLNFWGALPIAVLMGVFWGVMLGFPVLRLRGDYLAIVTLGFGEIIRILATSDWLSDFQGGPQGVLHIPYPKLFGYSFDSPQAMYYLVVFGSLLAAFVTIRLRDSRLGRQWMAMREDEDVAEAMGINLVQTKLLAFAIGAGFSALAGAIFAGRLGNIFPHSFNLLWSINALSVIIVGGLGSIPGVIVGALILVGLPEILREFSEYRMLMYGLLLIVMMLVKPEGFIPEPTRKRELRAGDEDFLQQDVPTTLEMEV